MALCFNVPLGMLSTFSLHKHSVLIGFPQLNERMRDAQIKMDGVTCLCSQKEKDRVKSDYEPYAKAGSGSSEMCGVGYDREKQKPYYAACIMTHPPEHLTKHL